LKNFSSSNTGRKREAFGDKRVEADAASQRKQGGAAVKFF